MSLPTLKYEAGTIVLENPGRVKLPPFFLWDRREKKWRAMALFYQEAINFFHLQGMELDDRVPQFPRLGLSLRSRFVLRPYQKEALQAWKKADYRGTVVLPTGAGKSYLALKAISLLDKSTLVVLPTIDLMNQWYGLLKDGFGMEVGILGGGYHQIEEVTVATYDSSYIYIDRYGDRFALLVFDEVHHLPSPKYSHIPQMSTAPYRLGLTATYRRPDELHYRLGELVGRVVYHKRVADLKGEHLSDYEIIRLRVELASQEREEYEKSLQEYTGYVREKKVKYYGTRWEDFIRESSYSGQARRALLARKRVHQIIYHAQRKLEILEALIKQHHRERMIIFTQDNEFVYRISQTFLIPCITHQTKTLERKAILDRFRDGLYPIICTSKVLNEGIDVPEAKVAVILSGSAAPREHLQRLGRILRKSWGKKALLYEVVVKGTKETQISYHRRGKDAHL